MEQTPQPIATEPGPQTLLRLRSFGPLTLHCYDQATGSMKPFPEEPLQHPKATSALSLLTVFLSQPHRSVARDWILEQLWPDCPTSSAQARLDDVSSALRLLLDAPFSTKEGFISYRRTGKRSEGQFTLATYPLIWVDADAFEWYMEQAARLDRFGQDSLAFWERAYQLAARGEFLPAERYRDWATARREQLAGQYRQCVHRLVQLLRERGAYEEALLRLRKYWQQHPTDEDALRVLIEMLGERERYQEAERYYEQAREALELDGLEPDAKTRDVMEFVRALQIQRISTVLIREERNDSKIPMLPSSQVQNILSDYHNNTKPKMIETYTSQEQHTHEPITYATITTYGDGTTSFLDSEPPLVDIIRSRRQLLQNTLSHICAIVMLSPNNIIAAEANEQWMEITKPSDMNRDTLNHLSVMTRKYWEMGDNAPCDFLSDMIYHLQTIVRLLKASHANPFYQSLCSLAGEHALAIGKALYDMQEYNLSLSYYTFSVKIAQEIGDKDLRAASLGRIALVLLYMKQPQRAHLYLQEAQQVHLHHSWIGAWLYAIEAELCASTDNADGFMKAIEMSKTISVNYPVGSDIYTSLTRFNRSMQLGFEGAGLLRLKQPAAAATILQLSLSSLPLSSLRRRATLFTDIGMACALQGAVKEACDHFHQALDITMQTKAFSTLQRIYLAEGALNQWKQSPEVKALDEHIINTMTTIGRTKHGYEY